ncbi:hypothetical protein O3P69_003584 [Scylla paramamosain]|uniref:Uncharacterized protein n=1 Tax=Scylla paramamosain TaxID=85552 RepID=A0AAW0UK81_SCYPA
MPWFLFPHQVLFPRTGPPRSAHDQRTMGARVKGRLPPLPPPTRRPSATTTTTSTHAHNTKDKGKLSEILEVCAAKVEESLVLSRRLSSGGIWVCLDTLQRGLMSPTEYRVYQEHLQEERQREQQEEEEQRKQEEEKKRRKADARRNISPYKC